MTWEPQAATYRTTADVRRDLCEVRRRIDAVRRALDIRDLVVEALAEHTGDGAARVLEGILEDARRSAQTLASLEEELQLLREELFELSRTVSGVGRCTG